MSRSGTYVVIASLIWLMIDEAIAAHRTMGLQFLGMFMSLCFLGVILFSFVRMFTEWRQRSWRAAVPFATCAITVVLFIPLGRLVSRAVFAWALPSYEAIVQQVESGGILVTNEFVEIPQTEKARLVYEVRGKRDANKVVKIMFFTEEGFPALHSGYLYSSSGEAGSEIESRWVASKLRDHWFFISN